MNSFSPSNATSHLAIRSLLLIASAVLLASCSSMQGGRSNQDGPVVPLNPPSNTTDSSGAIRHDIDSPRIAQLWTESEKARKANNLDDAERYIQEALQIAPQDGVLWSRAAELKLSMLDPVLAETYAGKSIAYAGNSGTLLHRNWLIIEHARELRGDLLGVRDAHKMVQRYKY